MNEHNRVSLPFSSSETIVHRKLFIFKLHPLPNIPDTKYDLQPVNILFEIHFSRERERKINYANGFL